MNVQFHRTNYKTQLRWPRYDALSPKRIGIGPVDDIRLSALLSADAHRGIVEFCERHGLTVAAFLEATGRHLPTVGQRLPQLLGEVVKDARVISAQRRKRPR